MARFVPLNFKARLEATMASVVATLFVATTFFASVSAQQPLQAAPAPAPAPPSPLTKAPATNAAPALPPDTLGKYGKILTAGDQAAHPFKLKMPLPDVGEVKIPSNDELNMRAKLEQLAMLSDPDIRSQLEKWSAYGKMSLRDQGQMLMRIQDFRDYRNNVAKSKAHDMGLLTLTPEQQGKFQKDYWDRRLQLDHDLAKQFSPIFKAAEQKMRDDLYRKYSAVSQGPIAQTPKPGMPPVASAPQPSAGNPPLGNPLPGNPVIPAVVTAPVIPPTQPVFTMETNSAVMPMPPVGQGPR